MAVTDLAITATSTERLTGVTITFWHTFGATTAAPYPVGPSLSENYVNGTSPDLSSATLNQQVWDSNAPCVECSPQSSRTVTDTSGGASFSGSNSGSLPFTGSLSPYIIGTYQVTFNALNNTVRVPGSAEIILAKGITYEEALLIQEDGSTASVPEPSSLFLLGAGLLGVAWWGLGRKRFVA
jgi:hypothetical protein